VWTGYTGKVSRTIWPELKDAVFLVRYPEDKGSKKTSDFRAGLQEIAPNVLGQMGIEQPQPME
jgi:hypothetical protein